MTEYTSHRNMKSIEGTILMIRVDWIYLMQMARWSPYTTVILGKGSWKSFVVISQCMVSWYTHVVLYSQCLQLAWSFLYLCNGMISYLDAF